MPKNAYFGGAGAEPPNPPWAPGAGGPPPPDPRFLTLAYYYSFCQKCVSTIERTLLLRKITEVSHPKYFGFFLPRFRAYRPSTVLYN